MHIHCLFVSLFIPKEDLSKTQAQKQLIPGLVAFGAGVKMAETLEGRESPSSGTPEIVQKYSKASETSVWNFLVGCLLFCSFAI